MRMRDLLTLETTCFQVDSPNKKKLLEDIAEHLATLNPQLNVDTVFEALLARERLGSTALGEGIALPHCRLECCTQPAGLLLTLKEPIEYDAQDNQAVDIIFMLLVPDSDPEKHLNTLSHIATLFSQAEYRDALRAAKTPEELFQAAINSAIELELAS